MGKAKIISGGADGLYTIQIDAGSQQQASRLEKIEASLASVLERIPEAQSEYLAATTRETYAAGALNAAIESYAAAVAKNPETASTADVDRLTGDYYTAARFAGEARTRLQDLTLQQRQLESDKAATTSAPVSETRQAWCADLTEDAAGEVATIEVPGEPGTVLVAPGGRAPSASDGTLLARELMTPEQAFFNAAILPGWQKWMPTFRTGTITAINSDSDTADVTLDDATSSAQGLGVNQTSSLSDVPVDYMECNASAFEVGDPCVVRFDGQRWDAPRVVGFAREPKACGPEFIYVPIRHVFQSISGPVDTGRKLHPLISFFDITSTWFCPILYYEGDDPLSTNKIYESIVKSSYVCLMSQASDTVDQTDIDVFGASTYASIIQNIPIVSSGFIKKLKFRNIANNRTEIYIKTEKNMVEYPESEVTYIFVVPGTDGEKSYGKSLTASVINGITKIDFNDLNNYFEQSFPSASTVPDEIIGDYSSANELDKLLKTVFNAPNEIKRISPSGAKSTYHLHKYSGSGESFTAIYKRGKAPA